MIPSFYQRCKDFPRTPNGKIDRKALKFILSDAEFNSKTNKTQFTPTEKIIYDIWTEILKIKEITKTDNFFEIGGNSLIAIYVQSRMEAAFKVKVGLRNFFDSPRIRDLAEAVDILSAKSLDGKSPLENNKSDSKIIKGEI